MEHERSYSRVFEPNPPSCALDRGELTLSTAELRVLDYLIAHSGRWVSTEELRASALRVQDRACESLVRVYVCNIRKGAGPSALLPYLPARTGIQIRSRVVRRTLQLLLVAHTWNPHLP